MMPISRRAFLGGAAGAAAASGPRQPDAILGGGHDERHCRGGDAATVAFALHGEGCLVVRCRRFAVTNRLARALA
ncbi:MAG: twin-arginine translocation signal domain-containing protein [Actinobacteria bacterium]|nr:twin-arginine translocation signal domain-containing protein [Actinomycetota bacterium]